MISKKRKFNLYLKRINVRVRLKAKAYSTIVRFSNKKEAFCRHGL